MFESCGKTNYHVENFHNYIRMLMHCIDKIFQIFQFYTSLPSYILWPILCYFIRSAFVWRAGKLMHLILDSMQLSKFLRVFHIYQDTCQLFLKQYRTKSNQMTYMLGSHGKKKRQTNVKRSWNTKQWSSLSDPNLWTYILSSQFCLISSAKFFRPFWIGVFVFFFCFRELNK